MISKIHNHLFTKRLACLLALLVISSSFRPRAGEDVVLNAGTSIPLETVTSIMSATAMVGQVVNLRTSFDVKVGGKTVVPAGSSARGQIVRAERAKGLGKEGFVEVQIKSVTAADGQEIMLTGGNLYQEGDDRQTAAILLGVFVCILFLTMKGKNAQVAPGYQVTATVASTTTVSVQ